MGSPTNLRSKDVIGKTYVMPEKCSDCPFAKSGAGLHLRRTLSPGRWREILRPLRCGQHFLCHKTPHETGNGTELVCAGAVEYQDKNGCESNLMRVMRRVMRIYGQS